MWLVSAAQRSESAIRTHIPHPSWVSLSPSRTPPIWSPQSAERISRCYAAGSHWLPILCMAVYLCQSEAHLLLSAGFYKFFPSCSWSSPILYKWNMQTSVSANLPYPLLTIKTHKYIFIAAI